MSTPDSMANASDGNRSLAAWAEEHFLTLDHVGAVRHIEGVDLKYVAPRVKAMLDERGAKHRDDIEEVRGMAVFTSVANYGAAGELTLWVKATEFERVGVVIDAKIFHSTEQSARADEELSLFVGKLEERVRGKA